MQKFMVLTITKILYKLCETLSNRCVKINRSTKRTVKYNSATILCVKKIKINKNIYGNKIK